MHTVERELAELIPLYLKKRISEIQHLRLSLSQFDFTPIEVVGHQIKGNALCYGFKALGDLGAQLEEAAQIRDFSQVQKLLGEMESFLKTEHSQLG